MSTRPKGDNRLLVVELGIHFFGPAFGVLADAAEAAGMKRVASRGGLARRGVIQGRA